MAVITRDIQTLKDALIVQSGGAGVARQIKRNKRKNLLDLFAVSNTHNENNLLINKSDGRYSYYWTLTDVEQYLYEGVTLKSPIITFQG